MRENIVPWMLMEIPFIRVCGVLDVDGDPFYKGLWCVDRSRGFECCP